MDIDFNPYDEFFCERLRKRFTYYVCKFEQEQENEKCADCNSAKDILKAIADFESKEDRKPKNKVGRPKKKVEELKMDPKPEIKEMVLYPVPYEENSMRIYIDFTQHSRLFGEIKKLAKRDFREIDMQIMYMLNTWIDIDKKYEDAKRSVIAKGIKKLDGSA